MREPQLRVGMLVSLLRPGGGPVLLIGEQEGLLAGFITGETRADVTWVEPCEHVIEGERSDGGLLEDGCCKRLVADCYALPFSDESFEGIASQFTLDYLAEPARALAEWRRVLKRGGTLALVTRNGLYRGPDLPPSPRRSSSAFSPSGLREIVRHSGLAVKEVTTLLPDLKLPALYRGDLSFSRRLSHLPYFRSRGKLLFVSAVRQPGGASCE